MSLTGRPFLLLLLLLSIAIPLAGSRLWSSGQGWTLTLRRIAIIATAQFAAVAMTAAAANDYGAFYPNWHDLYRAIHPAGNGNEATESRTFGAPEPSARTIVHKAGVASPSLINGNPSEQISQADAMTLVSGFKHFDPPALWPTQGAEFTVNIPGEGGNPSQDMVAYLPPSFFSGRPGDARLPLAEILTGYPGTPSSVQSKMNALTYFRRELAAGTVPPMAFLIARPAEPYPRDTECMDVPNGPQTAHYLAYNAPNYVASALKLDVTMMATMGYSSGGYCALKLAMTFPDRFLSAGSMSGYYAAQPGPSSGSDIFGGDPMVKNEADLAWRLDHLPAPNISILLATARDEHDADGFEPAQHFLAHVKAPMRAREIIRQHGGHNFWTWMDEFPAMIQFTGDQFAAAARGGQGSRLDQHTAREAQPLARPNEAKVKAKT